MTTFTKEQLREIVGELGPHSDGVGEAVAALAAFALSQMERAENAEKRMKAWGCPDEDFICLNCGRETPCMTEADLKPGDPGVPCTFDLTYPQMIERIHYHEDQQRRAKAERDRLRGDLADALDLQAGHGPTALASVVMERDRLRKELEEALLHAERVMFLLEERGAAILPHLMDDDENPGEMLRQAILRARERGGRG